MGVYGKQRGAMARERLGRHEPLREVVSTGLDIEQDREVSTRMYVRLDDHERKMKAFDEALMWRSRRTYIAEALLGFLILVAIILAGISLWKIDKTADLTHKLNTTVSDLEEKLQEALNKTVSNRYHEDESNKTMSTVNG